MDEGFSPVSVSGVQAKTYISECLLSMRSHIPKEFVRKPKALAETERWMTTEFRLFCCIQNSQGTV